MDCLKGLPESFFYLAYIQLVDCLKGLPESFFYLAYIQLVDCLQGLPESFFEATSNWLVWVTGKVLRSTWPTSNWLLCIAGKGFLRSTWPTSNWLVWVAGKVLGLLPIGYSLDCLQGVPESFFYLELYSFLGLLPCWIVGKVLLLQTKPPT